MLDFFNTYDIIKIEQNKPYKGVLMGFLTTILSLLMVLWGFPTQIIKNHREKSCGIVLPMVILPTTVFIVRMVYAFQKKAWGIVIPDTIGFLLSTVILTQWFIYNFRKKKP